MEMKNLFRITKIKFDEKKMEYLAVFIKKKGKFFSFSSSYSHNFNILRPPVHIPPPLFIHPFTVKKKEKLSQPTTY